MTLHAHLIASLDEVVDPLATLLSTPLDDPFTTELVVAPSVGVQQWLAERLARRLGASAGNDDGIVANIRFGFPGALVSRALGGRTDDDPWAVDRLTFTILDLLAGGDFDVGPNRLERGKLAAARGIADLFDRYHFHRPAMILDWARGDAVLTAVHGEPVPELPPRLRWQFDLWRAAHQHIGQPSPPERVNAALAALRTGTRPNTLPSRVAVVGVTAMSPLHLRVVHALANVVDVHLWLSHPSPALLRQTQSALATLPRHQRFASTANPARNLAALSQLDSWTRSAQSMQVLLASEGITIAPPSVPASSGSSLLARVQHAVRTDTRPPVATALATDDRSLRVHRCHGPARQAEVLRETLLHTFKELPGLDPRDILIVAPNITQMAPHLEAVFGEARSANADDPLHLPVVVADRSLRQTNEVAELLAILTELPSRRFGLADFREIAELRPVQQRLGVDTDTIDTWLTWAQHLRVRWGLTPEHRTRFGLPKALGEHSWIHAAQRLAYGALVPDASAAVELGGVIPAVGLEVAELPAVGALVQLLSTLTAFVDATTGDVRRTGAWCDLLQSALDALCRVDRTAEPERAAALRVLSDVRTAAASAETPVAFDDFRTLLAPLLGGAPGSVSLRSGRITATSLVPLRGVPYRVICLVGLDDGALAAGDGDGDDLMRQYALVGDPDSRAEQRQSLLETLLAARERVIITCTGRDPRSNAEVPLITPLAELVDLIDVVCDQAAQTVVEQHPRHAIDPRNFSAAAPFGHVGAHAKAARVLVSGAAVPPSPPRTPPVTVRPEVSLADLAKFLRNPLDTYVTQTLQIDPWEDTVDSAAVIELSASPKELARAAAPLLEQLRLTPLDRDFVERTSPAWREMVRVSGMLPPGAFGDGLLESGESLIAAIQKQFALRELPLAAPQQRDVRVVLDNSRVVSGALDGVVDDPAPHGYAMVRAFTDRFGDWLIPEQRLSLWIYAISRNDATAKSISIGMHHDKKKPGQPFTRQGLVEPDVTISDLRVALSDLLELYDEAAVAPRPMFGDTAKYLADRAEARKKFGSALFGGLRETSSEHRLYGASPRFEDVYADDEIAEFYARFYAVVDKFVTVETLRPMTRDWTDEAPKKKAKR